MFQSNTLPLSSGLKFFTPRAGLLSIVSHSEGLKSAKDIVKRNLNWLKPFLPPTCRRRSLKQSTQCLKTVHVLVHIAGVPLSLAKESLVNNVLTFVCWHPRTKYLCCLFRFLYVCMYDLMHMFLNLCREMFWFYCSCKVKQPYSGRTTFRYVSPFRYTECLFLFHSVLIH